MPALPDNANNLFTLYGNIGLSLLRIHLVRNTNLMSNAFMHSSLFTRSRQREYALATALIHQLSQQHICTICLTIKVALREQYSLI